MSSYLVQAGTNLYSVTRGGVATTISLPGGVTLTGSTDPCRTAAFTTSSGLDTVLVVVNGGSADFFLTSDGTARPLSIAAPTSAPVLSAGSGTGLTGVYKVACTFKVKDANGATVLESGLGPSSAASSSLSNTTLRLDNIPTSNNSYVTARGVYRTTAGGNIFYPWFDIDDNTNLSEDRGVADASLSVLITSADTYGNPPPLKLIASWNGRLWGVPKGYPDELLWTEDQVFYGWGATNSVIIPPASSDAFGVTALIPRRDQLGIARFNRLHQITGSDNDSFQRVEVSESLGCVSQESVVVVRDVAYFLGERGVVEWSAASIGYCSEAQVDAWFTTDTYFNRALFTQAKGRYNYETDSYELLLASAGSSSLDRWISFDLRSRRWFGPHKTTAFTTTCVGNNTFFKGTLTDTNEVPITVFGGSDGFLYRRDASVVDDAGVAVPFSVDLPYIHGGEPDYEKFWGELTVAGRAGDSGTLTITPKVGDLDATTSTARSHDLSKTRERLSRLGVGKYFQLNLSHSEVGKGMSLHGLELPFHLVGRR